MRRFALFLIALASQYDPQQLNGEPIEWHTPKWKRLTCREKPPFPTGTLVPAQRRSDHVGIEWVPGGEATNGL